MKKTNIGLSCLVLALCFTVAFAACGNSSGKAAGSSDKTGLQQFLDKAAEIAETASSGLTGSDRDALAMSLSVMGYDYLKPQILGQETPKIKESDYPLKKSSSDYAIFGLRVLGLKSGESMKAAFNFTIKSVNLEGCTMEVEQSDFTSDAESGALSVYYFGDPSVFGASGPTAGQKFLGYVSYHASTINIGIALPIIVIDGIQL
ncbi:MAG: hypothetical protein LBT11_01635 [Treponema sp.]|jgi:hypothetical protein|nr:hypothetical protein [Treponema sp.]